MTIDHPNRTAPDDESWTVTSLRQATEKFFRDQGLPSPRFEAELLMAHVLGNGDRMWLYQNTDRPVSTQERDALRPLVGRRAKGEPMAYILGEVGFWTLSLQVDNRVLIPRPETEHLVELSLQRLGAFDRQDWRIVDVGTGSGAIALALASELPQASVLAIDLSAGALEVARENVAQLELGERVSLVRGDLLSPLQGRQGVVDLIVSNPPYVEDNDPDLAPAVREHEPAEALFAGTDGLDRIRALIPQAWQALRPGGFLLVEFGSRQGQAVRALAAEHFEQVEIVKDFSGLDRVLVAQKAGELAPRREAPPLAGAPPEPPNLLGESEEPEAEGLQDPRDAMLEEALDAGLPIIDLDDL